MHLLLKTFSKRGRHENSFLRKYAATNRRLHIAGPCDTYALRDSILSYGISQLSFFPSFYYRTPSDSVGYVWAYVKNAVDRKLFKHAIAASRLLSEVAYSIISSTCHPCHGTYTIDPKKNTSGKNGSLKGLTETRSNTLTPLMQRSLCEHVLAWAASTLIYNGVPHVLGRYQVS